MLSFMAMEYFRQSPVLFASLLALALFMLVFFAVTVRTLTTRRASYERVARLPLEHGEVRAGAREPNHEDEGARR